MTDDETFDVRIVERNISQGLVSADDYKKHLKKLEDSSDNAELVPIEEEETDAEQTPGKQG